MAGLHLALSKLSILILLFNLAENDPTISTVEKAQKRASLLLEVTAVTTANSVVTTFSNGTLFPSMGSSDHMDPVSKFFPLTDIFKLVFLVKDFWGPPCGSTQPD